MRYGDGRLGAVATYSATVGGDDAKFVSPARAVKRERAAEIMDKRDGRLGSAAAVAFSFPLLIFRARKYRAYYLLGCAKILITTVILLMVLLMFVSARARTRVSRRTATIYRAGRSDSN